MDRIIYNMTAPRPVNLCGFCGPNITHVIDPSTHANDRFAKPVRTTQGEMWKCGTCVKRDFDDSILKQAPDSPAARNILAKRRREIEEQKKRIASLMKFHKLSGEKL